MENMIKDLSPTTITALIVKYDNHIKKLLESRGFVPFGLLEHLGFKAPKTGNASEMAVAFLTQMMSGGSKALLEGIQLFEEACAKDAVFVPELLDYWESEFLPTALQCVREKISLQVKAYRKQMCSRYPEDIYDYSYYNYIIMKTGDFFERLNTEDYYDRYTDCDMLIRVVTLIDNFIDEFHSEWSGMKEYVDVSCTKAVEAEVLGFCANRLKRKEY